VLFIDTNARAVAVPASAFAPLELSILEAPPWEEAEAEAIVSSLESAPIELVAKPLGVMPLWGIDLARSRG
jgi:hypothetical protein